jgi:uncharacterized membrane protein YGL010W
MSDLMASYGHYHRHPLNRLTHFVGVPVIVFAVVLALSEIPTGAGLPLVAILASAATVAYYVSLDRGLGLALGLVFLVMLWGASAFSGFGHEAALITAAILFVGGWIVQILGHMIEGNRPALLDNLLQIVVAPLFLAAELGFALGWGGGLKREVEARLQSS